MTLYPTHLTNFWNEVPNEEEDPFETVPDYQRAIHTSPYCCMIEENSFPHLMPVLEGYQTPSPVSFTPRTESQIVTTTSLPALPAVSSTELRAGRYSCPEIRSLDNPLMNSPTSLALGYINSTLGTSLSIIEGDEGGDEEESSEGPISDGEDTNIDGNNITTTTPPVDSQFDRRAAVATLPISNEGVKKNTNITMGNDNDNQPKKRQRTSAAQLDVLEKVYQKEKLPSSDLRKELAEKLKMTPRRVQVWFQNKRAKEKRMSISK